MNKYYPVIIIIIITSCFDAGERRVYLKSQYNISTHKRDKLVSYFFFTVYLKYVPILKFKKQNKNVVLLDTGYHTFLKELIKCHTFNKPSLYKNTVDEESKRSCEKQAKMTV